MNKTEREKAREKELMESLKPEQREFIEEFTKRIEKAISERVNEREIFEILSKFIKGDKTVEIPPDFHQCVNHWSEAMSLIIENSTPPNTTEELNDVASRVFDCNKKVIYSYYRLNKIMYIHCADKMVNIYKRVWERNTCDKIANSSFKMCLNFIV